MITAEEIKRIYRYENLNRVRKERENSWIAYRNLMGGFAVTLVVLGLIKHFHLVEVVKNII